MEAHIVTAQGKCPRILTVGAEARSLAKDTRGNAEAIDFGSTKADRLVVINRLLKQAFEAGQLSAGATTFAYGAAQAPVPTPSPQPVKVDSPLTLTDVETFIQAADHGQLARVLDNGVYRLRELQKGGC